MMKFSLLDNILFIAMGLVAFGSLVMYFRSQIDLLPVIVMSALFVTSAAARMIRKEENTNSGETDE
jgi:hypothetical protein